MNADTTKTSAPVPQSEAVAKAATEAATRPDWTDEELDIIEMIEEKKFKL